VICYNLIPINDGGTRIYTTYGENPFPISDFFLETDTTSKCNVANNPTIEWLGTGAAPAWGLAKINDASVKLLATIERPNAGTVKYKITIDTPIFPGTISNTFFLQACS
jgi:hypothetical protein